MANKNLSTGNFGVGTSWTPTVVNPAVQEWANKENTDWRLTPAARSKVAGGATKSTAVRRTPESSEEYTKRRIKEETKRTWRSDVADTLHGIGEGVLALHPYTAIPYYGAKVGQDILNGTYGWQTALNLSVPLFHLSPQAVGLREATNVALEDVANAGSKTARNWRIAREINLATKRGPYNIPVAHPTVYRTEKHPNPKQIWVDPIKQDESGLTSLKFFERPSKITEAERLGIPKGERNLTISERDYPVGTAQQYVRRGAIARMDDNARYLSGLLKRGGYTKVEAGEGLLKIPDKFSPTGYHLRAKTKRQYHFTEDDPYIETRLESNLKLLNKYNSRTNYFGKDLPLEFYEYLEQIKDIPINPNFTNLSSREIKYPYAKRDILGGRVVQPDFSAADILSKYVYDFRKYLENLGYNTSKVSDNLLLLLITDLYGTLTKGMTGKTKGQVFWHEGPKYNEVFDFSHTGENTGNMGALGPGNYFSSGASAYGEVSLPYLITGIKETPIASLSMIDKGLIPEYVSPSLSGVNVRGGSRYFEYLHSSPEERLTYPQELRELYENALAKAKKHIATTPIESSRLWIDPALIEHSGVAPRLSLTKIKPMEFMLRRNTGIKSLFPHPSTFTRNANGRIIINRIWEDPRVNYKQGGKMNTIEFLQKGKNIKVRRLNSTTIEETYPDGTKKRAVSEIPLQQSYPEFAALLASRLGSSFGVGGLPSLMYKLYKHHKDNLPLMYGSFDLGKKKSFSNTLNEPLPLPIRILDALPFMKNGNKIHIKKKNRGKFTSYCGGKVTDSCIRRAKASGNPTLVKRATFAANARKWKH